MKQETEERVRENTSDKQNEEIDNQTYEQFKEYGHKGKARINERLQELQDEWDIERALELNAAGFALTGILLGAFYDKKWLILPGVVTAFLIQHAVQGWCPPLPLLRRLGFRTRDEINREKYALKALHGDFKNVRSAQKAWEAAE